MYGEEISLDGWLHDSNRVVPLLIIFLLRCTRPPRSPSLCLWSWRGCYGRPYAWRCGTLASSSTFSYPWGWFGTCSLNTIETGVKHRLYWPSWLVKRSSSTLSFPGGGSPLVHLTLLKPGLSTGSISLHGWQKEMYPFKYVQLLVLASLSLRVGVCMCEHLYIYLFMFIYIQAYICF